MLSAPVIGSTSALETTTTMVEGGTIDSTDRTVVAMIETVIVVAIVVAVVEVATEVVGVKAAKVVIGDLRAMSSKAPRLGA